VPGREVRSEDLSAVAARAVLTRGLGRSYGDSALPPPGVTTVAGSVRADRLLAFDLASGLVRAEAGLSLRELIWIFLPRGFFPPVVPGTQYATLGGMVAADVHGKGHHVDGTFGRHVTRLKLLAASGETVECSRELEPELFRATIGGMGLTGHILEVEFRLARVPSSWIAQEAFRVPDLDAFLAALAASASTWPFTVGWIDCLARGASLGRGVMMRGRWADPAVAPAAAPRPLRRIAIPFYFPSWALGTVSVKLFNRVYAASYPSRPRASIVHPEKFFFPLDAILQWNRIYGRRGFTQFQCVLPEKERPGATRRFLTEVARCGGASFLAVIKDCGEEGEGLLSFPRTGVSVALDLPVRRGTRELVEALGEVVADEGGRVYLAKDAFLRADQFARMEPRLAEFNRLRDRWDPGRRLRSAQSVRLLGDPA
jgi:FAD/FMN-containing dehydrogenase